MIRDLTSCLLLRLEERIARMKKNQERRLHRKNAKIVKEGGTPMQLNRPLKPDTTVMIHLYCVVAVRSAFPFYSAVVGTAVKWDT